MMQINQVTPQDWSDSEIRHQIKRVFPLRTWMRRVTWGRPAELWYPWYYCPAEVHIDTILRPNQVHADLVAVDAVRPVRQRVDHHPDFTEVSLREAFAESNELLEKKADSKSHADEIEVPTDRIDDIAANNGSTDDLKTSTSRTNDIETPSGRFGDITDPSGHIELPGNFVRQPRLVPLRLRPDQAREEAQDLLTSLVINRNKLLRSHEIIIHEPRLYYFRVQILPVNGHNSADWVVLEDHFCNAQRLANRRELADAIIRRKPTQKRNAKIA